jgi:hypothetical protein
MVAVSDHSATNGLIDRLGLNAVNRLLDTLGLTGRRVPRGTVIGVPRNLGHAQRGVSQRLVAGRHPNRNKPGWLDGVRTDAALGLLPKRPDAVAVMTTYGRADRSAEAAVAAIGKLVHEFFDRLGRSSPLGRQLP